MQENLQRFLLLFLAQAFPNEMEGKSYGAKFNMQAVVRQRCGRGGIFGDPAQLLPSRGTGAFPHSMPPLLILSR